MWEIKDNKIKIIKIKKEYTDYLRDNIDNKIPYEHNDSNDLPRPFIGILVVNDGIEYVIPLTSPKKKHLKMKNTVDFHKIGGGNYGAINFNNMFPLINGYNVYEKINTSLTNITDKKDIQYINLLINQLNWLNQTKNKELILKKAEYLYNAYYDNSLNEKIKERCCNFIELDKRYNEAKEIFKEL